MITDRRGISRRAAIFVFTALLLFTTSNRAQAQQIRKVGDYALIFCTVWDAQNRPVYGVTVKVRRADEKKVRWQAVSDHQGEMGIRVPPGEHDYVLTADVKLPKGKSRPEVKVHITQNERIDTSIHLSE